jgi:hypothetical protein
MGSKYHYHVVDFWDYSLSINQIPLCCVRWSTPYVPGGKKLVAPGCTSSCHFIEVKPFNRMHQQTVTSNTERMRQTRIHERRSGRPKGK